jgi:hypothetical protein
MNGMLRPSGLIMLSAALALGAIGVVFWPVSSGYRSVPLPVPMGDQEIAWLYQATDSIAWERFVTAAQTVVKKQAADLALTVDMTAAFPEQTTSVPEIVVSQANSSHRLHIRWYKLTSDQKVADWVEDLTSRDPPPLAIIGGDTSDVAIDLARHMRDASAQHSLGDRAPLLLLTTASADEAGPGEGALTGVYAGRTFRFCFTDRRMAEVVTDFIWSQEELRPDRAPVYLTYWEDDPYSVDLNRRFCEALPLAPAVAAARDWAWSAIFAVGGAGPVDLQNVWANQFRAATPESAHISYSVGTFADPNRWEEEEAIRLMEAKLERYPQQQRPLLVIPAATEPTRRFLRALVRTAPVEARRFVVATGDSIEFNTIYRDRNLAWPIQDLPFHSVFFFHRNPVDPDAGFPLALAQGEKGDHEARAAGTEDLLLYEDILGAIVRGAFGDPTRPLADSKMLGQWLSQARWSAATSEIAGPADVSEPPFFDQDGNRRNGTGEHVVHLRPRIRNQAVLPEATIDIWAWQAAPAGEGHWHLQATLPVHYEGYTTSEPIHD